MTTPFGKHFVARVPLRWRDLDHQGHVYHAEMLTLLDEGRTRWFSDAVGKASPDEYLVVRVEIDYVGETRIDGGFVEIEIGLARLGRTSLTTVETVKVADGTTVARARVTVVMWDRAERKPRRITAAEIETCSQYAIEEFVRA